MRRALAFLVLLSACGGGGGGGTPSTVADAVLKVIGPSGGTISTTDGRMSLDIPAGALAADTEISIRPLPKSDLGADFADVDVAGAWEMGPDGLQFAEPVTVTRVVDETPLQPDGSMSAAVSILLSGSADTWEYAGDQMLIGDADAGTKTLSGTITHFSKLVEARTTATFEVTGVPDTVPHGSAFFVDMKVMLSSTNYEVQGVRFSNGATLSPLEEPAPDSTPYALPPGGDVTVSRGPFDCSSIGEGRFSGEAELIGVSAEELLVFVPVNKDDNALKFWLVLRKGVTCQGELPSAREFDLALTKLEAAAAAFGFPWPGDEDPPRPLVVAAGENEVSFVDTDTGEEVQTISTLAGFNYGAVPLTDGDVPHLLAFGSYGAELWAHRNDKSKPAFGDGAFGNAVAVSRENVTDATLMANGGLLLVENSAGRIRFLDPDGSGYSVSSGFIELSDVVSAVETSDGSILAVTDGSPGGLYTISDRNATPLHIGDVGSHPRRVRVLGDLAVVSAYGDGVSFGGVTTALRSGGTWQIVDGIVGIRPVGIDLVLLQSGHVGLAATSYDSDSYDLMEIDTTGAILSRESFDLPSGNTEPGHATILPGGPGFVWLAITCHGSNTLVLIPVPTD